MTDSQLCVRTIEEVLTLPRVTVKRTLPHEPGIYFVLIDGKRLVYVGISSTSLKTRWVNHHRRSEFLGYGVPLIAYLVERDPSVLAATERYFIETFAPVCNARNRAEIQMDVVDGEKVFTALPPISNPEMDYDTAGDLLTVPVAAKTLGLTRGALWKLARDGEIEAEQVGKYYFLKRSAIEAYRPKVRRKGRPKES